MRHVRTTRQCRTAVRGSTYQSGRCLPPGFVEVDQPSQVAVPSRVAMQEGLAREVGAPTPQPESPERVDPVSNALGFWNWMIDNGYEPTAEEHPGI